MSHINKYPEKMMSSLRGYVARHAIVITDWKSQPEAEGGPDEQVLPEYIWLALRNLETEGIEEYLTPACKEALMRRRSRYTVTGSQAGAVCDANPYMSVKELYDRKKGIAAAVPAPMNEDALERGKFAEQFVIERAEELLIEKFGAENVRVFTDKRMFMAKDPDRDFMVVNPDAFAAVKLNGRWLMWHIEAKTSGPYDTGAHDLWREGKPPLHYVLQARHEMAVLGCSACLLICAWGLEKDEIGYTVILRKRLTDIEGDLTEEQLVERERAFVEMLETGREPANILNYVAEDSYYGRLWASARKDIDLPETSRPLLERYMDADEEVKRIEKELAEAKQERARQLVQLHPLLKDADRGELMVGDTRVTVCRTSVRKRPRIDYDKMKNEAPALYEAVVETTTTESINPEKARGREAELDRYRVPGERTGEVKWKVKIG